MAADLYDILGVKQSSEGADIKKAYRRLAMKHHPDRNKGDAGAEKKFKEIQLAYSVLSDPEKKQAYDQYGHAGIDPNMRPGGGASDFGDFGDGLSDIFSDLFGGGGNRGRQGRERGSDLQYDLTIPLEEAVHGKTFEIRVPTTTLCKLCKGSGAHKDSPPVTCKHCNGQGQVRMSQGFISIQQTCQSCGGRGKTVSRHCPNCHGRGATKENRSWSVKIPAGIDHGDRIRLEGKGEQGISGEKPGDLYVRINIQPHEIFERDGVDLYCEAPIDIATATLGGEIKIPTLEGDVLVKIPKETQTGKRFRLRNRGITSIRRAARGDLYVQVTVETPIRLTKKQEEIMRNFGESICHNVSKHSPKQNNFLGSLKKFFGIKS